MDRMEEGDNVPSGARRHDEKSFNIILQFLRLSQTN